MQLLLKTEEAFKTVTITFANVRMSMLLFLRVFGHKKNTGQFNLIMVLKENQEDHQLLQAIFTFMFPINQI